MIMNKKKESSYRRSRLSERVLAGANKFWTERRMEENIRFLVKKILKHLQNVFRDQLFERVQGHLLPEYARLRHDVRFDYCFFGYYFANVKSILERPIESFFHPRSRASAWLKANPNIPRTISQGYLAKLRSSELFVRDVKIYVDRELMGEVKSDIFKKIGKMLGKWEQLLERGPPEAFLAAIDRQFKSNPKLKLPWSFQEVLLAIQKIYQFLGVRGDFDKD